MSTHKMTIIQEICSTNYLENNDFNVNKCLTYLDEFDQKLEGTKKTSSLVSITSLRNDYINNLEKKWLLTIREQYGFTKGNPIHFTKVRKISQTVTYTDSDENQKTSIGWNDEYVLFRANSLIDFDTKRFKQDIKPRSKKDFIEEYKVWCLFRKTTSPNIGSLDIEKLKNFYNDIFLIIKEANFDILCTTIMYDTGALHKINAFANQCTSPHTIAFGEHLDLLCFYLKNGFSSSGTAKSLSTKLRWDGDDGFNQKSDYRLLFNKVISLRTTHYQAETVRKCLDEIRFINKSEIGFYDNIENQKIISHIGCDIADFITYFVGKHSIKDELIKFYKNKGFSPEESLCEFEKTVTFKIGDRVFSPYDEILKEKILTNMGYTSIQIFNECHYNKF